MSTPTALRVAYRDLVFYKRIWRSNLVAAFGQPMLYLLGFGLGVGGLVDRGSGSAELLGGTSYFAFYATALLATTAMFTAGQEALWSTADGFQWSNAYRAMIATPIEPRDVATGFAIRYGFRAGVGAIGVAIVLALFDDTRSWGLIPGILGAVLTALAIGMPIAAWTASRLKDHSFPAILRFVIMPMFLFGGAFFPVSQLPDAIEPVARITPLWHGVELCRGWVLGGLDGADAAGHIAALGVFIVGGWALCVRACGKRLRS